MQNGEIWPSKSFCAQRPFAGFSGGTAAGRVKKLLKRVLHEYPDNGLKHFIVTNILYGVYENGLNRETI
jgi:hypothetical protein